MTEPKLSAKPGRDASPKGRERRGTDRLASNLETSCQPLLGRDELSWQAQVRDISSGGIGLVLRRRFEPGTVLVMDLEGPAGSPGRSLMARVVHATQLEDGHWLLGCTITSKLEDDDLQLLGVRRVRPDVPDCRAWVRFSCEVETSCQPAADPQAESWLVKIVNVSPGGMGLVVPRPVAKGALLQIELPAAPGKPARTALLRVVQTGEAAGPGWLLGCEFADQLREEDLQGLLG